MSDRDYELQIERRMRMLRAAMESNAVTCSVSYASPLTVVNYCVPWTFNVEAILDDAPRIEAELLRHISDSRPALAEALLDAMTAIYVLRVEVEELNGRLESQCDYPDTRW